MSPKQEPTENKMKKILLTLFAVFAIVAAYTQITVTLGSALLQNPGTVVHLPVSVKGLNGFTGGIGVTGMELHVGFVNTNVVYDTTLNFNSITPFAQWFFGATGSEYGTNWIEPSNNKLNIPDNTVLFDIVFHYLGGTTDLTFDTARCLLIDSAFNIIPGVHYINGRITPAMGSGESRWNGTGSWNTIANWSNGIPGDSTNAIIETGEVTVLSSAVSKSITISLGTTVNLSPGFSLTANRNYTNNGNLNLLSDATGTGSLIVRGVVSGTGVNKFMRYLDLTSGTPSFVSSPVSGASVTVFGSNSAEKYIESTTQWASLPASDIMGSGIGCRVSGVAPATVAFQGQFSSGDITVSNLSYTGTAQAISRGFNLLGNPYPSAIQWEQGNWERTNLDYAVYVWSDYKYVSWNGSVGALKNGIIPAMQGFFVKSNASGGLLTIPSGSRLHSSQPFYKNSETVSDVIALQLRNTSDTSHYDEAFVHILAGSTSGFDKDQDAWKLTAENSFPQICTKGSDLSMLSINTQPDFVSVPVEFTAGTSGSYQISFSGIESFNAGQPLFFEDKATSTVINIRNSGMYVFTSDGTPQSGRFMLHFHEVGLAEHPGPALRSWIDGRLIHITSSAGISQVDKLEIYNLTGQTEFLTVNLTLPATIPGENLTPGLYIMKLTTPGGVYTQKLLVR